VPHHVAACQHCCLIDGSKVSTTPSCLGLQPPCMCSAVLAVKSHTAVVTSGRYPVSHTLVLMAT
jgi:hypothetical protein